MIKKLVVLQFIFKCILCLYIQYELKSGGLKNLETDSTGQLSPGILPEDLRSIRGMKYKEDEIQIDTISDFPHLENVTMANINQSFVPSFKSVPKLYALNIFANDIVYVKRESFSETPAKIITLSLNQISVIEYRSFGAKVTEVYLLCNKLRTFSARWFQNPSILEKIDLSSNYLTKLDPYAFNHFPRLYHINLGVNAISSIGKGAFGSQKYFSYIELGFNNLTQLNSNSFIDEKFTIDQLYLENNNLTYLEPDLLRKMNVTSRFIVGHNPWQCSCWSAIKEWVHDDSIIDRNQSKPACVAALSFANVCVPHVDYEIIEHYRKNVELPIEVNIEASCATYKFIYGLAVFAGKL